METFFPKIIFKDGKTTLLFSSWALLLLHLSLFYINISYMEVKRTEGGKDIFKNDTSTPWNLHHFKGDLSCPN